MTEMFQPKHIPTFEEIYHSLSSHAQRLALEVATYKDFVLPETFASHMQDIPELAELDSLESQRVLHELVTSALVTSKTESGTLRVKIKDEYHDVLNEEYDSLEEDN